MNNILRYKDYYTKIEYSVKDAVLYGKIEGINDLVMFDSESAVEIEAEFHGAVDEYLEFCKRENKEPNKAFSGTFNVRIDPELHRKLAEEAVTNGNSINREVEKAIASYVYPSTQISMNIPFVWIYEKPRSLEMLVQTSESFRSQQIMDVPAEGLRVVNYI